jgi:hypothetical protein
MAAGLVHELSASDFFDQLSDENQSMLKKLPENFRYLRKFPTLPEEFCESLYYATSHKTVSEMISLFRESDLRLIEQYDGLGLAVAPGATLYPGDIASIYLGEVKIFFICISISSLYSSLPPQVRQFTTLGSHTINIDDNWMVDSKKEGSLISFVNFSHEPNLKMVRLAVHDVPGYVWGFEVSSEITLEENTLLSVDYGSIFDDDENPRKCGCQSILCQGFIGHLQYVNKERFRQSSLSSLFSLLPPSSLFSLSLFLSL